jgi:peptidoglycan hydrolase-like amidase
VVAASGADLWLDTTAGQSLLVNGEPYEGRLRLLPEAGGITPVNHLPLERYIASVVGAEMPSSWSLEALKAQAVAARSYALAHMARPASRYWHLGDTTRWQAYRGLESVTQRTNAAAVETNGLILSYQGGIVESLYAANSQISLEAHGHLGASMSQEGAQQLASSGQRYNQILGHYYQGAALARLQIGGGN